MARREPYESGLKPSLATNHAKASERVIADFLGLGAMREGPETCPTTMDGLVSLEPWIAREPVFCAAEKAD